MHEKQSEEQPVTTRQILYRTINALLNTLINVVLNGSIEIDPGGELCSTTGLLPKEEK